MSQPQQTSPRPTARQLRYLRALAQQTGQTFTLPRTRRAASAEIHRMRKSTVDLPADVARERDQITRDLQDHPQDATRIRPHEVSGYGSSASWA